MQYPVDAQLNGGIDVFLDVVQGNQFRMRHAKLAAEQRVDLLVRLGEADLV